MAYLFCFLFQPICIIVYIYHCTIFKLDPAVKEAFDVAYDNIYAFHVAQRVPENYIENMPVRK